MRWSTNSPIPCFFALHAGYIYPALLTALVPFRSYVLERLFDEKDIAHLDPTDESEEEHAAEQRAIHLAQRNESFDSEDALHFPNRADFHPKGMKKAIHDHEKLHAHPDGEVKDIIVKTDANKSNVDMVDVALGDPEAIELAETGEWRGSMSPKQEHFHDN